MDAVPKVLWSSKYDKYVSRAFLEDQGIQKNNGSYSIDPANCSIVFNIYGYADLIFKNRKVKRLSFEEYLELKNTVKEVKWE